MYPLLANISCAYDWLAELQFGFRLAIYKICDLYTYVTYSEILMFNTLMQMHSKLHELQMYQLYKKISHMFCFILLPSCS